MRDAHGEFQARGVRLAVVTQGTVAQTRNLCERHDVPFRCLADPELAAYRAFGLTRGTIGQVMGPQVLLKAARSMLHGNAGAPGGDIFQMPGAFVIATDGILKFAHQGRDSSDMPGAQTLLAGL